MSFPSDREIDLVIPLQSEGSGDECIVSEGKNKAGGYENICKNVR